LRQLNSALCFSSLASPYRAQRVSSGNPPDGAGGKTGLENFSIRSDGEAGCVNDAAAFFPIGADFVGVFGNLQSVADRKHRAGFFNHLFGLVERIDGKGDDLGVFLLEFLDVRLVIGDLPNAIGSPDSAIKNDDRVFAFQIGGNIQNAAANGGNFVIRKRVAWS
jgi:hypothetical protein